VPREPLDSNLHVRATTRSNPNTPHAGAGARLEHWRPQSGGAVRWGDSLVREMLLQRARCV